MLGVWTETLLTQLLRPKQTNREMETRQSDNTFGHTQTNMNSKETCISLCKFHQLKCHCKLELEVQDDTCGLCGVGVSIEWTNAFGPGPFTQQQTHGTLRDGEDLRKELNPLVP